MRRAAVLALVLLPPCGVAMAQPAPGVLQAPVRPACISSPFGPRVLPGLPKAGTFHYGIDLPAPAGGAVLAAAAGRVISIHRRGAGGLEVALQHGDPRAGGFVTLYAHLGSVTPALAEGRRAVAAGEKLGVVGRTGVSYGTHVYFELRAGAVRLDPEPLMTVPRCRR